MARPAASERRNTREDVHAAAFRLFGHYDNKQALHADCMQQRVGGFECHVFAAAARERDPIERIFALCAGHVRLVDAAIVLPLGDRGAVEHRRVVGVLARIFFTAHANEPELAAPPRPSVGRPCIRRPSRRRGLATGARHE